MVDLQIRANEEILLKCAGVQWASAFSERSIFTCRV